MSEPMPARSDSGARRAVEDGDDYVINGEKLWISNGGYRILCSYLRALMMTRVVT